MLPEEWADVCGYEGKYQVSNCGRVRNKYGRILAQSEKQKSEYLRVHLAKNNRARWFSVHRLVAEAFVPKPDGKNIVNHLDHNKANNHASNLEWTTLQENAHYSAQEGRYKIPYENLKKGHGLNKKAVVATAKDGTEYIFESGTQAARVLGVNQKHIGSCCKNVYGRKTVGGYSFRYA